MSERASPTVRPPVPEDEPELHGLISEHFDGDYTVDLSLSDPDRHVRVAERDGRLLGSTALTVRDDRAAVEEEMYFFDSLDPVAAADRYGLLEMGYVRREHTGEGVGSRLLERLHEVGRREGVTAFVADAWFHEGPDSPERLFDRYGYEVVRRRSIADRTDGVCRKCGPDCGCAAALTVRYDREDDV